MDYKLYCIPTCTTCKKAKAWLLQHDISYQDINLLQTAPTDKELENLAGMAGLQIRDLVNKRSQVLKKMNISLSSLNESEISELIKVNPRIMLRPILTDGSRMITGFKESVFEELLLHDN